MRKNIVDVENESDGAVEDRNASLGCWLDGSVDTMQTNVLTTLSVPISSGEGLLLFETI